MPERMTKEERTISLAIEKARKAKELLQQESIHERLPLDSDIEVEKIKKPKVTNVKPKNQTQKKEGYGLAGETTEHKIKKAEGYDMVLEDIKGTRDAELAIESFLVAASNRVHYDKPRVPVPEKLMSMVRDYLETGFDKKRF